MVAFQLCKLSDPYTTELQAFELSIDEKSDGPSSPQIKGCYVHVFLNELQISIQLITEQFSTLTRSILK